MSEPMRCGKCGEPVAAEAVSKLMNESRMSFSIAPHPGELMNAENVGGSLTQMGKLLRSIGRDMGAQTNVLVENVSTDDDGKITFKLLLARHEPGVKKRKAG